MSSNFISTIVVGFAIIFWAIALILIAKSLRIVVGTNDVHIVQSTKHTVAFGKGQTAGNTYYKWPSWIPSLGVQVTQLPVSVFSLSLKDYPGYDMGRVPFMIDIIGFFRIAVPNMAAERLASFEDLKNQLLGILQGAIRSILASNEIEGILQGRAQFGEQFTQAVDHQLEQWGVQSVKTIELMDIRDAAGSQVIANIMAKKKSLIEMQSRTEVAGNIQKASIAEVEARRQVGLAEQEALETVGKRTAEKDMAVGVASQKADQQVKAEMAITADKDMSVRKVNQVRTAEIEKEVQTVRADQTKAVAVIEAEGEKQQTITRAEGVLGQQKLNAEGVLAQGTAKAEAERLLLMAPVSTQIELAKEIGANDGYQKYLVSIKTIEVSQVVGVEQAKALEMAQIKVIANTGNVIDGVKNVMGLFSPQGGLQVGAALDALGNTERGAELIAAIKDRLNGGGAAQPPDKH